jgi:chemotaxis methyl-accepting protein methylase
MQNQHSGVETKDDGLDAQVAASLGEICAILHHHTGHDFSRYKAGTLLRRIRRRIQLQHLGSVADYMGKLERDAAEAAVLLKDLLIGVTQFFRDPEAFRVLAQDVMPRIVANKTVPVRVWIPGCASGEEAYSVAILLCEHLDRMGTRCPAQIFATDLDAEMLAEARQGRYAAEITEQVSPERLARFFVREGESYRATKELREMCIFSEHSLIRDPPFLQLDLISCRNVLIYLGAELQKKLFPLFHYALGPGGFLFLGPSEGIVGSPGLFEPVDAKYRIFRRREAATSPPVEFPLAGRTALRAGLGTSPPLPANSPAVPSAKDPGSTAFESALPVVEADRETDRSIVERLEDELRATRAELSATVEELESANEELKSANEELVSTNEESWSLRQSTPSCARRWTSWPMWRPFPSTTRTRSSKRTWRVVSATPTRPPRGCSPTWLRWDRRTRGSRTGKRRHRGCGRRQARMRAHAPWSWASARITRTLYLVADETVMRSYGLDITKRTRAEETLRASEERFRTLSDNAQDSIARFDREGRYLYVNPFITRALGLPAEAIVGKTAEELGRNAGVEEWEARLREVFASGQPLAPSTAAASMAAGTMPISFPSSAATRSRPCW